MGVLGQEAIAGMDRVDIADLGGADDTFDFEITVLARSFTDTDGFICELNMERIDIGLRVNRERFDPKFLAGADDPQGDLATVGDEYLVEHDGAGEREAGLGRADGEEGFAEFDRLAVGGEDVRDDAAGLGLDLVHHLHGFDDTDDGVLLDFLADADVGG